MIGAHATVRGSLVRGPHGLSGYAEWPRRGFISRCVISGRPGDSRLGRRPDDGCAWSLRVSITDPGGRHRSARRSTGLLLVGALVLRTSGFLPGLLTVHLTDPQPSENTSAARAGTADASDSVPSTSGPVVTSEPADASSPSTSSAAPPDPGPGAGDENAFFAALQRSGVPFEDSREVLLALGSNICHTPAESRTDPAATAQHIVAALRDEWTPDHAVRIVEAVDATLCRAGASGGR